MYDGASPCRALYVSRHSLNWTRCGTGSQWRWSRSTCLMSDAAVWTGLYCCYLTKTRPGLNLCSKKGTAVVVMTGHLWICLSLFYTYFPHLNQPVFLHLTNVAAFHQNFVWLIGWQLSWATLEENVWNLAPNELSSLLSSDVVKATRV